MSDNSKNPISIGTIVLIIPVGILIALISGLIKGLWLFVNEKPLEVIGVPNQGIKAAKYNMFTGGLIGGVIGGVFLGIYFSLIGGIIFSVGWVIWNVTSIVITSGANFSLDSMFVAWMIACFLLFSLMGSLVY